MTNDNHQLIQQLNEARRRLDIMRIVVDELNKVSSLSSRLQNILAILHKQFHIDFSMILLPDEERNALTVHSSYGYNEEKLGFEVPMGSGIIGLAALRKMPINITGLERKRKYVLTTSQLPSHATASFPGLAEPESQIAIPLLVKDELVAVLLAESYNVCVFSKEDESFLITLSQSIATSILNSRLFDTMEETIALRTEQLRKSNETKNRLFSLIAHDLRGPLTSFHNITRLVSRYNKDNERERIEQLSQRIDQSVEKLNALLDNLLNWALSQTKQLQCVPQKLSVYSIIHEVHDQLKEYFQSKEVQVRTECLPLIEVNADYNMMMAVFRNLLSNAIKYSHRGGLVHLRAYTNGNNVIVQIKDLGIGIDPLKLKSIFEPDERKSTAGTEKEKGTGLGLMLAKEFIQLNGGSISINSEVDKGTTVTVELPLPSRSIIQS